MSASRVRLYSMYKPIAVSLILLVCSRSLLARIGETEAQVMARYGQSIGDIPTETFGPVRGFALREYLVGVKILNGTSAMEMVSRNDQAEIKPQEIDALLKKHGADVEWKVDKFEKPDWKRWRTQDGSLVAVYDSKRHFLYVNSKEFYNEQGKRH
jgi:hypothetical protein